MARAGQRETKTEDAADLETLWVFNQGPSLTQIQEGRLSFRKNAILAKPDLAADRNSGVFPLVRHAVLSILEGSRSPKVPPGDGSRLVIVSRSW